MNTRWRWIFSIWLLLLWPESATAATDPVSVVLSPVADPAAAGEGRVVVTIRNDGDAPVNLHHFLLPFGWPESLPNNQFEVRGSDGKEQAYIGYWVAFAAPLSEVLVPLGAHQTLSGTVDLRYSYAFDKHDDPHYTVRYRLAVGFAEEGQQPDPKSPDYATDPNRSRDVFSNVLRLTVQP
ncbi:hypothetical protein [Dyella sp.]|jgi:hypothetical protein|uniref:hypothetical protein n=1 Tax=Dyella sp. TaxID=1869338 RepID=UPI002D79997F|nr:hypothetical protein [Dyella sp.]HET6432825.1 hypothetical protein [Dyella sp.]